jgi:hypothetical protein
LTILRLVDVMDGLGLTGAELMDGFNFFDHAANAYPDFQTTEQS